VKNLPLLLNRSYAADSCFVFFRFASTQPLNLSSTPILSSNKLGNQLINSNSSNNPRHTSSSTISSSEVVSEEVWAWGWEWGWEG